MKACLASYFCVFLKNSVVDINICSRKSWSNSLKHLVKYGIYKEIFTAKQIAFISRYNISSWARENNDKYVFCEFSKLISEELALVI